MRKILIFTLSFIFVFSFVSQTLATADFNPNYIVSDAQILDYDSMNLTEIQSFLTKKGGFLAKYSTTDPEGKAMTAARIIYDRAQTNKISPKFILVMLQKEMSLVEDVDPVKNQLDWALGYGCPDGASCNERWRGFWKQVNSATLQFYDYLENPQNYTYKKGEAYTFKNKYSTVGQITVNVTPVNDATAALYNYTPHVYNGNYNFFNIWQRYFTKSYPNGSLLRIEDEVGVWLIQNGKKRPFLSKSALTSRFDENKIIEIEKGDLDAYEKGAPIKFPNYSLVRSPGGHLFLLVDSKRRGFDSPEAFRNIGYNPEEIMDASWEDINSYEESNPITATSTYPTGALLQDNKTGGVYWVEEGKKSPLHDRAFLTHKFKHKKIIAVSPEELDKYGTITPILFGDGELLTSNATPAVYLVDEGQKRPFMSSTIFEKLGYRWENIITVSPQFLSKYKTGGEIKEDNF